MFKRMKRVKMSVLAGVALCCGLGAGYSALAWNRRHGDDIRAVRAAILHMREIAEAEEARSDVPEGVTSSAGEAELTSLSGTAWTYRIIRREAGGKSALLIEADNGESCLMMDETGRIYASVPQIVTATQLNGVGSPTQ